MGRVCNRLASALVVLSWCHMALGAGASGVNGTVPTDGYTPADVSTPDAVSACRAHLDAARSALVIEEIGVWSDEVAGLRGRLILTRASVTYGQARIQVDLELENLTNMARPRLFVWDEQDLFATLLDAKGEPVPPGPEIRNMKVGGRDELLIPIQGSLRFTVSKFGASTPGVAKIVLARLIRGIPSASEAYVLSAVYHQPPPPFPPTPESRARWRGQLKLPAVRVPLTAPDLPDERVGELIASLGPIILQERESLRREALALLSLIEDERTIPWYVEATATDDRVLFSAAVRRLSVFDRDDSLAGIKRRMHASAEEFERSGGHPECAQSKAQAFRLSVVRALESSPHAGAADALWEMRDDANASVRLAVVQAFAGRGTLRAKEIVMASRDDADERIRREAKRLWDYHDLGSIGVD